jgi:hypothetical protein
MIGSYGYSFGEPGERTHPLVNMIFIALEAAGLPGVSGVFLLRIRSCCWPRSIEVPHARA